MADEIDRSKFSDAKARTNLAGKDAIENIKTMNELVSALSENTKSNENESNAINMQMFLDQFKNSMVVGNTTIKALRGEFEKANEILNNPKASETEKNLAIEQIESIKSSVESEEEKREKIKAQEEANSILNKMSGKLDSVGKSLDGFVSNALGAGGLLATALLFIDPDKFFKILSGLIEAALNIVSKISAFFKEKILPNLGKVEGEVDYTSVLIGSLIALFSGTIVRAFSSAIKVVKTLVTAAKTFSTFIKTSFVGEMISNLATTTKNFMSAGITKLKNAAIAFKAKMLTEFIPNMLANLKSMMASLSGKIMTLMNNLAKVAKAFRVTMLTTFIPGMIAALTTISATLATVLAPLAPILVPILAIAAAFGLVLLGLNKIKESMGFTSIFDVIMYGVSFIKDGLAHLGNVFIKIAKKVAGLGAGLLEVIGIDVPDWVYKARDMELMATDNAARKKIELDQKAEATRLEKQTEEKLDNVMLPATLSGDTLLQGSQANAQASSGLTTQNLVTQVSSTNPVDNSSKTNVSMTYAPISPTSSDLAAASR
jgi:hypothetical protein